jgi:hypothetical protein
MTRTVLLACPHPFIVAGMKPYLERSGYATARTENLPDLATQARSSANVVISLAVSSSLGESATEVFTRLPQGVSHVPVLFAFGNSLVWFHVLLNYLVPYCVASYRTTKNEMTRRGNNQKGLPSGTSEAILLLADTEPPEKLRVPDIQFCQPPNCPMCILLSNVKAMLHRAWTRVGLLKGSHHAELSRGDPTTLGVPGANAHLARVHVSQTACNDVLRMP